MFEKEAEEYVKQNYCETCIMADDCESGCIDCYTVQAYIASAEPREKRISELEATNKNISNECHKLVDSLEKKQNEVAELKEQNTNLQEMLKTERSVTCKEEYLKKVTELEKENAELKEQNKSYEGIIDNSSATLMRERLESYKQLTKAKELLEKLLLVSCDSDVLNQYPNCSEVLQARVEAEQFLKE